MQFLVGAHPDCLRIPGSPTLCHVPANRMPQLTDVIHSQRMQTHIGDQHSQVLDLLNGHDLTSHQSRSETHNHGGLAVDGEGLEGAARGGRIHRVRVE